MKQILGLDLGTNSIGWALLEADETDKPSRIVKMGSRIIPMDAATLGDFEKGNSQSQTSERTRYRSIRRLRERHLLRRERLHRILHILGYLPAHYDNQIDFTKQYGKFLPESETKLPYSTNSSGQFEFIFQRSFEEMLKDFSVHQPLLVADGKKVPYDWTLYYLRKKALTEKIEKEELAWLLLHFNQKRGYYQLRGEEEEEAISNELVEFYSLKVVDVVAGEISAKKKDEQWYDVHLENGWVYRRSSKVPLEWTGKIKEFIVTTQLESDGSIKKDREGNEKRSFRAPKEDDWTLVKKKTEYDIEHSNKTVGCYIYNTLLNTPTQKIKGNLVRTIERKFYKSELIAILNKQAEFHPELKDASLYYSCLEELYKNNETHRNSISRCDFTNLFVNDVIYYQRPLKSKKSLISDCPYEKYNYVDKETGEIVDIPIKCIAKSHPLFQEFRLWQFIRNLRIYERERIVDGKLQIDVNVTNEFLPSEDAYCDLFDWMNNRKEIDQKSFLKYPAFGLKTKTANYRWNYMEEKNYPCNETRAIITDRLKKVTTVPDNFLSTEIEQSLWHILYSVNDKIEVEKALSSFAKKHQLSDDFVDVFKKTPPFKNEYGSYSAKAIKKLLPLMRMGRYWSADAIDIKTQNRIEAILNGEASDSIKKPVFETEIAFTQKESFKGLPVWLACYVIYNRHSETSDLTRWKSPKDVDYYLNNFKQFSLRNPIVEQVITETLRVVRDIWKKYGDISEIHVELGRDMKNPADKRQRISEQNAVNENTNLRIKALLIELFNDAETENVRPYSPMQQEILRIYEEGALAELDKNDTLFDDIMRISRLSQPSHSELIKYKCWLQQKYRSPYTGEMIPLAKLFTSSYEIEHVIPQSRYFDDSFSNKVICEAAVNKDKGNCLGYEYIKNNFGKIIEVGQGRQVKILSPEAYEDFVKSHYAKSRTKMAKLLMDDIPDSFIERQLNDSRYISSEIKRLLSNVVRTDDEAEATSKNVISCTGGVTSILKQDWGINDVWNSIISPRFERMNQLTKSSAFGKWENKSGKRVFQTDMPIESQKGFNKKRIDHRHHAMDALIIACATRSHINYLNNESAKADAKETRFDLRNKLCFKNKTDNNGNYSWSFHKPWPTFTQDAYNELKMIIVSFKQNLRVINKTVNRYQHYVDGVKVSDRQVKGDSWAIRKSLHKETVSGQVTLQQKKTIRLSAALEDWQSIVDKELKNAIKTLILQYGKYDAKTILKYFKDREYILGSKHISNVEVYYYETDNAASRVLLDDSFDSKKIASVTDSGIKKILSRHLSNYNEEKNGKTIEHPGLAFSADGLDALNSNLIVLNGGKPHKPIKRVRTYEAMGSKFAVGTNGNKKSKYVEAAKGTNLFFAIYQSEEGKRSYTSVPLNEVIERQKNGLPPVPEISENGAKLLFWLSPNDLVYVPTQEEIDNAINLSEATQKTDRIYKMVSCSETSCFFIPQFVASPIIQTTELGSKNKAEKTWSGQMIKACCVKLKIDRLGNIV